MKKILLGLTLLLFSTVSSGIEIVLRTFEDPNDLLYVVFKTGTLGDYLDGKQTIETYSFAGKSIGMSSVPGGGFDPILSIFKYDAGLREDFLYENDDITDLLDITGLSLRYDGYGNSFDAGFNNSGNILMDNTEYIAAISVFDNFFDPGINAFEDSGDFDGLNKNITVAFGDEFTVTDIYFDRANDVPEPGSLLLMTIGSIGLFRKLKKS